MGWQLVIEGITTPEQLRTTFTYQDVIKVTESLNIKNSIERKLTDAG